MLRTSLHTTAESDAEIAGFSLTQRIETSVVSGHLVDSTRCVFIDIFSCAEYSTGTAEAFTRKLSSRCAIDEPRRGPAWRAVE